MNGKDIFGAGDRRAIYNWPAIMRAGPGCNVYICKGESNAKALITTGLLATTVLSHKWTPECIAALTGCHLFILQDHDKDGEKLATNAQRQLAPVAASTRIIPAPHLWKHLPPEAREIEPGDDIKDWVELGGDPQRLLDICREIPADGIITAEPYQFRRRRTFPRGNGCTAAICCAARCRALRPWAAPARAHCRSSRRWRWRAARRCWSERCRHRCGSF